MEKQKLAAAWDKVLNEQRVLTLEYLHALGSGASPSLLEELRQLVRMVSAEVEWVRRRIPDQHDSVTSESERCTWRGRPRLGS